MSIIISSNGGGGSVARLQLLNGVTLSSSLVAIADQNNNPSFLKLSTSNISLEAPTFLSLLFQQTLGTRIGFSASQTLNVPTAGNGIFRMISNAYTINNLAAQTGSITGYYLNATETALNGMTHNLIDLQLGGVSKFRVTSDGSFGNFAGGIGWTVGNSEFRTNGAVYTTTSNFIRVGGTTSSFPMLKRNGAAIEFRLADDSAYCDINAFSFNLENFGYVGARTNAGYRISFPNTGVITHSAPNGHSFNRNTYIGSGTINASAILQADSTTQGFLPPRMTTTQINAIATPAEGLVAYNTTISHLCIYQSGSWVKVNHSPM